MEATFKAPKFLATLRSTSSGPEYLQQFFTWLSGKCDPWRICGFRTRAGQAISESHSLILFW